MTDKDTKYCATRYEINTCPCSNQFQYMIDELKKVNSGKSSMQDAARKLELHYLGATTNDNNEEFINWINNFVNKSLNSNLYALYKFTMHKNNYVIYKKNKDNNEKKNDNIFIRAYRAMFK